MNNIKINKNLIINNNRINKSLHTGINNTSFQEILDNINKNDGVKFSKHAIERLRIRNISLSKEEVDKLHGAINKAGEKGVNEALILMNNKAFIASIKNNTIITAATDEQLKDNVFTKIDGAVII